MAINWTSMNDLVTNSFDLIITMVGKVPDVIVPIFGVIIILLVLKFGRGIVDAVVGMLKIKL